MEQKRGYMSADALAGARLAQQSADERPQEEPERTAEEHQAEGGQEYRLEDTGHAVGRALAAGHRRPLERGHGPQHPYQGAGHAPEAKEERVEQRATLSRGSSHRSLHRRKRALSRWGGR